MAKPPIIHDQNIHQQTLQASPPIPGLRQATYKNHARYKLWSLNLQTTGSSNPRTADIKSAKYTRMLVGAIHKCFRTLFFRVTNPVRVTSGSVSPLAGIQMIHDRVDSAHGVSAVQLAAKVLIVGRSVLRNKLDLVEASMILSADDVALIDLLGGGSLVVVDIDGLGSWLG